MTTSSGLRYRNETTQAYNTDDLSGKYLTDVMAANKYIRIVMYALGIPGNILAFFVWIRKPMLQSSGVYLVTLALTDLLFLLLDLMYTLETEWDTKVLSFPIICEGFSVLFYTTQYASTLLTFGFTTERYIAIKYPFRRHIYCTVTRACCNSCFVVIFSLALSGIQGYFWKYNSDLNVCEFRLNRESLWNIWSWCTEMTIFLMVPLVILTLNCIVMVEIYKSRQAEYALNRSQLKSSASTIVLLCVSTFLVLTQIPASLTYILQVMFPPGDDLQNAHYEERHRAWQAYYQFREARFIIEIVARTHFSIKFYIYLMAGDRFRREFQNVLACKRMLIYRHT